MSDGHTPSRPAPSRDLASNLEVLDGLLSTLTDVLDFREVFDRVYQLAQRVPAHDLLGVMEISRKGDGIRLLATAGMADVPRNLEASALPPDFHIKPWDITIIDDVQNNTFFSKGPAAKAGMHSVLTVPIRFGGRFKHVSGRRLNLTPPSLTSWTNPCLP